MAVTSRTRIGSQNLLCGYKFPLKVKGNVCTSCVRSVMLYGCETWCLGQNEIVILQRTE